MASFDQSTLARQTSRCCKKESRSRSPERDAGFGLPRWRTGGESYSKIVPRHGGITVQNDDIRRPAVSPHTTRERGNGLWKTKRRSRISGTPPQLSNREFRSVLGTKNRRGDSVQPQAVLDQIVLPIPFPFPFLRPSSPRPKARKTKVAGE
jgi:hypothetical protein